LVEYGLDSLFVVQLTNILRKELKNITNTVIFEYQTIDALVDHFMKTQKEALIRLVNLYSNKNSSDAAQRKEPINAANTDNTVINSDQLELSIADVQRALDESQEIQPELAADLLVNIVDMSDAEVNILLGKL